MQNEKDPYYKALLPPSLGDKMIDWQLLAEAGGQSLLQDRDVIEFGPSFGLDFYTWAPITRSYTMIDSAPDIKAWLSPLVELYTHRQFKAALHRDNLQRPIESVSNSTCDVVIDFGTIDNVLAGFFPYREAVRILRPGGHIVSTYANYNYFQALKSPWDDEERFVPDDLVIFLEQHGCDILVRKNEDQARAGIVARKR